MIHNKTLADCTVAKNQSNEIQGGQGQTNPKNSN